MVKDEKKLFLKELETWKDKGLVDDETHYRLRKHVLDEGDVYAEEVDEEPLLSMEDFEDVEDTSSTYTEEPSDPYKSKFQRVQSSPSSPWVAQSHQGYPIQSYGMAHRMTLVDIQKLLIWAGGVILFLAMLYLGVLVWTSGYLTPFGKTFILAIFYLVLAFSGGYLILESQRWFDVGKTVFFVSVIVGIVCTLYVYFILEKEYLHPSIPLVLIPTFSLIFSLWRRLWILAAGIYVLLLIGITGSLIILDVSMLDSTIVLLIFIDFSLLSSLLYIHKISKTMLFTSFSVGIVRLIEGRGAEFQKKARDMTPQEQMDALALEMSWKFLTALMVFINMMLCISIGLRSDQLTLAMLLLFIPPIIGTVIGVKLGSKGLSIICYLLIGLGLIFALPLLELDEILSLALFFWFICLSCSVFTLGTHFYLTTRFKTQLRDENARIDDPIELAQRPRTTEEMAREYTKSLIVAVGIFGFLASVFSAMGDVSESVPLLFGIFLFAMVAFPAITFMMGFYLPSYRNSILGYLLVFFGLISALGFANVDAQNVFITSNVLSTSVLLALMVNYSMNVDYDMVRGEAKTIDIFRNLIVLIYLMSLVTYPLMMEDPLHGIALLGILTFIVLLWSAWKVFFFLLSLTVVILILLSWIILVGFSGLELFGAILALLGTSVILFLLSDYIGRFKDKLPKKEDIIEKGRRLNIKVLRRQSRCNICGSSLFFDKYYRIWRCLTCEGIYMESVGMSRNWWKYRA